MRIAYLDCFAGISGDMFLGALIDAGVDPKVLHAAAAAMGLGASLKMETVDRSGISCTKVHVLEGGHLAESAQNPDSSPGHTHVQLQIQEQRSPAPYTLHPETQHLHKTGHAHTHPPKEQAHEHRHGRSLTVIRQLIVRSRLAPPVVRTAIRAFELLGASEARIHNVPVDQIHFHEVGAVDAIIDIVCASAGIHALAAEKWVSSPLNVGGGMVDCAHGRFPVPAPATADLLRTLPTYSADVQMELVTPTGAALLRTLVEEKGLSFGPQPAMRVERIGYGAGTRNPKDFPNVLRLSLGESAASDYPAPNHQTDLSASGHTHPHAQTVTVLETALDDLSPQLLAHVAETALQQGALDVMLTPLIMKKGRPGTLLTVLCNPADRPRLEDFLLRETSTLGLRIRDDRRVCLDRSFATVATPYGPIKIKLGLRNNEVLNANPEFEDCRAAATAHNVPLKQVQQAAIAAYIADSEARGGNG